MRKVIFDINLSIDGCCDHTKMSGSDEIFEYFVDYFQDVDMHFFGRKTYQLMVPFWPEIAQNRSGTTKAMNDFALAFDAVDKIVVFSRTLEKVEGKNTRIVRTSPKDELLKLKQEEGKNITIGGLELLSQLIDTGLIDEYRFIIHPVVVGEGRRLLDGTSLQEKLQLKFVDSTTFKSGCIVLRYLK